MAIQIVTIISLAVLVLELLFVVINCLLKNRADRISFIRTFKKGKCAIVYFTAIPLYCIGHMYNGQDFFKAFFDAVNKIISLVVLRYDTGSIDSLMVVNPLYKFTIYFTFVLVGINALLFTISLTNQHIWCEIQELKAAVTRRDKLFLFGNNRDNIAIYSSDKKHSKAIVDSMSDKDSEKLYLKKISFVSTPSMEVYVNKIFARLKKIDRQYILIVNTGDDEKNMTLCRSIIDNINAAENKDQLFLNLRVYVFGDPRYETIYADIVSSASGCIQYANKYQKIAIDFIDKYPFAQFMSEEQIDYSTSLVRAGVDINVLMIGFGKTNQQIFMTSVANNQFLTDSKDGPVLKPVKYYIFDKDEAKNNKNLNHSYYRYKHECSDLDTDKYLPLPAIPAEETYYRLDVNDTEFYDRIRNIVTQNSSDINFVIIGFGTDLENIDMAQKLVEKRGEWGLENLIVFVKVRVWHQQQTLLEENNCFFIANECDVVYDVEKIVGDKMFHMAKMRNEIYDLEYTITHNPEFVIDETYLKKHHEESHRNWYVSKSQMERESSVYCCLSLRSKLNLMGLDYCKFEASEEPGLTEQEYLAIYAKDDMPIVDAYNVTANGKPIVTYTLDFKHSMRKNMAIHEHQRWNSFMISKGMIPSSIDQIVNEKRENGKPTNGKNYAVRRHGNLTTSEGLIKFRQLLAERQKEIQPDFDVIKGEAEFDVIKYDYQLMDDAYWLLTECGYKIIRKAK